METVPVIDESLSQIVGVIGIWTKTFPYDFRDERIMNHVKHIVARCADTTLGDTMSDLLSALLIKLTDLEKHEEEMKYYKKFTEHQVENSITLISLPLLTFSLIKYFSILFFYISNHQSNGQIPQN